MAQTPYVPKAQEARNKAVVERYFREVLDQKRIEVLPELLTPDVVLHRPGFDVVGLGAAIKRLRAKANAAGMRLAGAELFIGAAGFKPLLEQGLYDVIMPDVKYAGGLAECLRIAELAARHGCAVSLHNPSGPVCHAHSVHLSAVLEGAERLEYQHGETPSFFAIAPGLEAPAAGSAALPAPFDINGDVS